MLRRLTLCLPDSASALDSDAIVVELMVELITTLALVTLMLKKRRFHESFANLLLYSAQRGQMGSRISIKRVAQRRIASQSRWDRAVRSGAWKGYAGKFHHPRGHRQYRHRSGPVMVTEALKPYSKRDLTRTLYPTSMVHILPRHSARSIPNDALHHCWQDIYNPRGHHECRVRARMVPHYRKGPCSHFKTHRRPFYQREGSQHVQLLGLELFVVVLSPWPLCQMSGGEIALRVRPSTVPLVTH